MLPSDVREWLESHRHAGYSSHVRSNRSRTLEKLIKLGIPAHSELAELYLDHGPAACRGWYDLCEADELERMTEFAHQELGVPANFVALTSIEGQGVTLYDCNSGTVYDVSYGQFADLEAGRLSPLALSVVDFLRWCRSKDFTKPA